MYVRDLRTLHTRRYGTQSFDEIRTVSPDGHLIALVERNVSGIAVLDRNTSTFDEVSRPSDGWYINGMSADGRYIAFDTKAKLAVADANGTFDCYMIDRTTRAVSLITADAAGRARGLQGPCRLSATGQFVAFTTRSQLVPADQTQGRPLYLKHLRLADLLLAPRCADLATATSPWVASALMRNT